MLLLVPPIREYAEWCVDLIDSMLERTTSVALPIPCAVCKGEPVRLPQSMERVLEPFLNLMWERPWADWVCYGEEKAYAGYELAKLVLRASVTGRIRLEDWESLARGKYELPNAELVVWLGFCPSSEDAVYCGRIVPTPIEILHYYWDVLPDNLKLELAWEVVRFVREFLLVSTSYEEAYERYTSDPRFSTLLNEVCKLVYCGPFVKRRAL